MKLYSFWCVCVGNPEDVGETPLEFDVRHVLNWALHKKNIRKHSKNQRCIALNSLRIFRINFRNIWSLRVGFFFPC